MTKYQKLSKREKIEHIWEYYRYHIFGGALTLFLVISLAIQIFGPQPPEPAVSVVIMGVYAQDTEKIEALKEEMENIIDNGENGPVELYMTQVDWNSTSPMDVAMNQKLMLMFQAQEIDVMIVEQEKFNSYIANVEDPIYESFEGVSEISEILAANQELLVKRKLSGDQEEKTYGLYSKGNKKLASVGLGDDFVVSVPIISPKKENAFKVIKWLYE